MATNLVTKPLDILDETLSSQGFLSDWRRHLEDLGTFIWIWDHQSDKVEFTPAWLALMGYKARDIPTGTVWFSLLHPEDAESVAADAQACIDGKNNHFDHEFRIRRADGLYQWIHSRAKLVQPETPADASKQYFVGVYTDTTARHADQHRIRTFEKRWNLALTGTNLGVWEWDIESGETFFSDEWCHMLDLDPASVNPTIEMWRELAHPDDLARSEREIAAYIAGEQDRYECECRIRTTNGSYKWILDRGVIVERNPDGTARKLIGTHDNITQRKQQELENARQNELLQQITTTVPGLLYTYIVHADNSVSIPFMGNNVHEVFGVSKRAAIENPQTLWTYVHPHDKEQLAAKVNAKQDLDFTYRVLLPMIGEQWRHALATCVESANGSVTYYAYVSDASERKAQESSIINQAKAIALANEDLEQFNYVAAHDLKEPLRAIRNLSEWIIEDLPDEAVQIVEKNLHRLRDRVDKLQMLVDDLAAYSRAGRQNPEQVCPTNTQQIIDQTLAGLDNIDAKLNLEGVEAIEFSTIEVALVTVLKNIISNAVKYHDNPDLCKVIVTARKSDGFIRWRVEDNGPGIPAEHHSRIFKMYQRLNPENGPSGSGSGLAIVKRIVSTAHGKIKLSSPIADNRGSCFSFSWPLKWPIPPV